MWFFIVLSILAIAVGVIEFLWIRYLIKELQFASDGILFIKETIEDFERHLTKIHKMSLSYRDDNLIDLLKHSRQIVIDIRAFKKIYEVVDEDASKDEYNIRRLEDEELDEVEAFAADGSSIRLKRSESTETDEGEPEDLDDNATEKA